MADLFDYKGLDVPNLPANLGGQAIKDDFLELADRFEASRYISGLNLAYIDTDSVAIGTGGAISADGTLGIVVSSPASVGHHDQRPQRTRHGQ